MEKKSSFEIIGELTEQEKREIAEYKLRTGRDGSFNLGDFLDDMAKATTVKFTRMCVSEMERLGLTCPVVSKNV
jgi:hypothetical protein